jgi:hypothetical protein
LDCNGLHKQTESVEAIKTVMPKHIVAMKYLENSGLFASLVFPENSNVIDQAIFSFLQRKKDSPGADFLDFLQASGINLTLENYTPFYKVSLISWLFIAITIGKIIHSNLLSKSLDKYAIMTSLISSTIKTKNEPGKIIKHSLMLQACFS